jgi:hypothetical protein
VAAGFCGGAGADRAGAASERVFALLLTTTDRVWGCGLGGVMISTAILGLLALRGSPSLSSESRGRFLRPILASWGVLKEVLSLLMLPGRAATLFRVDDLVARPPALLLREERREMDAIDGRGTVAHGSARALDEGTLVP